MSERSLHKAVCDYLKYQFPGVLFNSDLSGATKLTMNQAVAMKGLRSNRGFPDLFIMEAQHNYHGLFIELKIEGTKLLKKNGDYASDHIREQEECLAKLESKGYKAVFAIGWDEAKYIIDQYLKS